MLTRSFDNLHLKNFLWFQKSEYAYKKFHNWIIQNIQPLLLVSIQILLAYILYIQKNATYIIYIIWKIQKYCYTSIYLFRN